MPSSLGAIAPQRPSLVAMQAARARIAPYVRRTPLVELDLGLTDRRIYLKLETLQTIGAFKIRPAMNALLARDPASLRAGVATYSSGNMAYGVAWAAREIGVPMAAYMVGDAPQTKIDGVRKLGGEVRFISGDVWWRYVIGADAPDCPELLINPVTDQAVLDGNGGIGLEIVEDLPEVDCVLTPYGGGSLTIGVAAAVKAMRPQARVIAVEGEHATPVAAALSAGRIVETPARNSFVKSIGGPSVLPAIWPIARDLIDGAAMVTLDQIVDAMRTLHHKAKIVAEGAAAAALAAALHDPRAQGDVVCVISGGNIDGPSYIQALQGLIPD